MWEISISCGWPRRKANRGSGARGFHALNVARATDSSTPAGSDAFNTELGGLRLPGDCRSRAELRQLRSMRAMSPPRPRPASLARGCVWLLSLAAAGAWAQVAPLDVPAGAVAAAPWVHAYAAFGQPKYPRGFAHFGYVNPDAPKGGTINLRNPDRRTSFDKFNPFTTKGNAPAGLSIFMFESLAVLSRRRAADHVRPAGRGHRGGAGQVVDQLPAAPEGALHQRRRGDRGRRQVQLRIDVGQVRLAGAAGLAGRGGARGGARRAHDPFRSEGAHHRHALHRGRPERVLAQVGAGARRQAQALRRDRHRVPDHQRALHHRQGRFGPAAGVQAQPATTGRATWACAAACSTGTAWSTATTRTRRWRARPSRPASSTSTRSTAGAAGCASTRGRSGTTGASRRTCSKPRSARACRPTC